jgi:hypothetical protein
MSILTSEMIDGLSAANISATNIPMVQGGGGGGPGGISITKTTSGVQTVLPAVDYDRIVMQISAVATEDYSDNTGTQATWSLGVTGSPTLWDSNGGVQASIPDSGASAGVNASDLPSDGNLFTSGALGTAGCILEANKAIIVTCTPAVGDGTGACKIVAWAVHAP